MYRKTTQAGMSLLEIIIALLLILLIFLMVSTIFPSSYQGSLQAARMNAGVNLARQVLERQKSSLVLLTAGNQTVDSSLTVQGRNSNTRYFYKVEQDSSAGDDPLLWKVTVQWEHKSQVREVQLVGACSPK